MEILDNFILPQSPEHMTLLKVLLFLTLLLFLPYLNYLVGSLFYSLYLKRKNENDVNAEKLSREIIDSSIGNKNLSFFLGVIPFLSLIFCYVQLLHLTTIGLDGILIISFIIFIIALTFAYLYSYSFNLRNVLKAVDNKVKAGTDYTEEYEKIALQNSRMLGKSGVYALVLLLLSSYLLIGSIRLATDPTKWEDGLTIFHIIFSLNTLAYFIHFLFSAVAVTSAAFLYLIHLKQKEGKVEEHYFNYVKKITLTNGLIFTVAQPVLILFNLVTTPNIAFSGAFFGLSLLGVLLLFLLSHFFYVMLKESKVNLSTSIFYFFILLFAVVILKDQLAFSTSTKTHYDILASDYLAHEIEFKENMGISTMVVSGEDIYNGRCVACHQFDVKLVGPPYKAVLPKYEGAKEKLVAFILNPVKIDPAYPPMPNQGLKPKEAEAVADYILQKYMQ